MKLIELRPPNHGHKDERIEYTTYHQSAPFFQNPRGELIHRVRSLFRLSPSWSVQHWYIVEYWCGNSGRFYDDTEDDTMLFDPGKKLVCQRCEGLAIAAGEKTSSDLVGRHVCVGSCRPVNMCCRNEKN